MPLADRADDPTIFNEENLWRRVHPTQIWNDPNTGRLIISSAAFKGNSEMSVNIASLTTRENVLLKYPEHSLAQFCAEVARTVGCIVIRDPLPEDYSHALVCGKNPKGHLTDSQAKKIAGQSSVIVYKNRSI